MGYVDLIVAGVGVGVDVSGVGKVDWGLRIGLKGGWGEGLG